MSKTSQRDQAFYSIPKTFKNKTMVLEGINAEWREVLHLAVKKELPEKYTFNTEERNLAFLEQGSVRLEGISYCGKPRFFFFLGSGCILREIPILSKNYHENMFLTTYEACTVYFFSRDILQDPEFISNYPHLLYNLAEGLARKASFFASMLTDIHESDPKVILARYIQKLCKQHNSLAFNSNTYKKDMASDLGLHRNTLSRAIKYFQEEKIISTFSRSHIEVLDFERLQELARN